MWRKLEQRRGGRRGLHGRAGEAWRAAIGRVFHLVVVAKETDFVVILLTVYLHRYYLQVSPEGFWSADSHRRGGKANRVMLSKQEHWD